MYGAAPLESSDEAKKALQAAKEAYVAEKDRYRRLREERKKRRMNVSTDRYLYRLFGLPRRGLRTDTCMRRSEMKDSPVTPHDPQEPVVHPVGESSGAPLERDAAPAPLPPQIISNARGSFPQLELYSVPRRSHTIHGTGHRRDASWGTFGSVGGPMQGGRNAMMDSIVRRLSDVRLPVVYSIRPNWR